MGLSVSSIIMYVITIFFVLGGLDRIIGNRFGLGAEFERGIRLLGLMGLTVVGLMSMAPVIAKGISIVFAPICALFGADASSMVGVFLSCDMGYPVAKELAANYEVGVFNGIITGAINGAAISFAIPVAIGIIEKEDHRCFSIGIMSALISNPIAAFIGGLMLGIKPVVLILNLIPVIVMAAVIVTGLLVAPNTTIKVFKVFAKLIVIVVTIGLVAAGVEKMVGIVVIPGLAPITNGFTLIGTIALSLAGSLPFLYAVKKIFNKPIGKLGNLLKLDETCVVCMIVGCTSIAPGFADMHKMNKKGKVVFAAWSASIGSMLGAHLGFVSATSVELITPLVVSKVLSGIFSVIAACFFYNRLVKE